MKKTMPESSYKEIKYQLDNKLVSSNQYWEIFEKALIEKDIKLLQDLIDYKHNTQSNVFIYCEDENIPRIIAAIPVDNIDYSINLFMKTGTSASRIMDEALAINADGNPDLISRKDAIIESIIKSSANDKVFFIDGIDRHFTYDNQLSLSSLKQIDESILIQNPQDFLRLALSASVRLLHSSDVIYKKSEDDVLRLKFISQAISNGADINKAFGGDQRYDIQVLNDLSSHLLNNQKYLLNADLFLETILLANTMKYDQSLSKVVNDPDLIDIKLVLVNKCADKGAKVANKLTVFLDSGHAFMKLDCSNCDRGEAASIHVGMYPAGFYDDDGSSVVGGLLSASPFLLSGYISKDIGLERKLEKLIDSDSGDQYSLYQEFQGGTFSKSKFAFKNQGSYDSMQLGKIPQVTYDITGEAAEKLFSRIDHLVNTCDKDLKYQFLGSNCFDFVQDMVDRAGLDVNILEDVTGFKTPANIFGIYKLVEEARVSAKLVGSVSQQVAEKIVPQIELARALYPMAEYIINNAAVVTNSAYKYIFGNKVSKEDLVEVRDNIESTQPNVLKNLNKLSKEFSNIRRANYTKNLEIANASYDEGTHRYTSEAGEIAIEKVRLMSDLDNQFRELSKDIVKLIHHNKELNSDSTDIDIKKIMSADKSVYKKIVKLAKQDLSILAKDDIYRSQLQALQSQLTQSKSNSGINDRSTNKKSGDQQSR